MTLICSEERLVWLSGIQILMLNMVGFLSLCSVLILEVLLTLSFFFFGFEVLVVDQHLCKEGREGGSGRRGVRLWWVLTKPLWMQGELWHRSCCWGPVLAAWLALCAPPISLTRRGCHGESRTLMRPPSSRGRPYRRWQLEAVYWPLSLFEEGAQRSTSMSFRWPWTQIHPRLTFGHIVFLPFLYTHFLIHMHTAHILF